jgi:hypothetical protein
MSSDDRFDDDRYKNEFEAEDDEKRAQSRDDTDYRDNDLSDDSRGSSSPDDDSDDDRSDDSSDDSSGRRSRSKGKGRGQGRSRQNDDGEVDAITGNGGSRRGYSFDLDQDGAVINVRRIKRGRSKPERIERGESWTFNSDTNVLVRSELYANGTEVSTFSDPNNDDIFTRISESFTPFGSNTSGTTV